MADMLWPNRQQPREMGATVEAQADHRALKPRGIRDPIQLAWPVVTIARELGDRDSSLGRNLARRLGFAYWDRGILMEFVHHLQGDRAANFKFDRRLRIAVEALLGTRMASAEVVLADYADEIRVIRGLVVRRGGVVINGRGAQLLVDPHSALRVRLVTPFNLRACRVETRDHIPFKAAEQLIMSDNRERAGFVLRATGHDVADPANFDLIVNTMTYPGERALGLVLMAYFAKFGAGPLAVPEVVGMRQPGAVHALSSLQPMGPLTGGCADHANWG
jgi:cytidylate kinase